VSRKFADLFEERKIIRNSERFSFTKHNFSDFPVLIDFLSRKPVLSMKGK